MRHRFKDYFVAFALFRCEEGHSAYETHRGCGYGLGEMLLEQA
jgi:hypothetical protein